ncbi:MAG: Crp/Fnr family transcriptional regulator [Spirochaetales bacterium]|nr:Crp/Fnr family transcriptional regulator [Spirochaetales bacterium]
MSGETTLFQNFGITVMPDEVLFREGDEGDKMYIIQSGNVKLSKIMRGKEQELAILGKGDFFGEMAIVTNEKRTATAVVITKAELLAFDRQGFLSMINKNGRIALNIIDKLCRRLQKLHSQMHHLVRKNSRGLVALHLFYAFKGEGKPDNGLLYEQTISDISLSLELPQETAVSILQELEDEGIIKRKENILVLASRIKLEKVTEDLINRE